MTLRAWFVIPAMALAACAPPASSLARHRLTGQSLPAEITPAGLRLLLPTLPPELAAQLPRGVQASFFVVEVTPHAERVVAWGTCSEEPVGLHSDPSGVVRVVCIDREYVHLGVASQGGTLRFQKHAVPHDAAWQHVEMDRFEGRDAYGPLVVVDVLHPGPKTYEVSEALALSFGPAGTPTHADAGPRPASYYSESTTPRSLHVDHGSSSLGVGGGPQGGRSFHVPSPLEGEPRWVRVSCIQRDCVLAAEAGRTLRVYRFDNPAPPAAR